MWKRGDIALSLLFHNIFYMLLDFHVQAGTRFSLRDKRLFEISEFEIARVNYTYFIMFAVNFIHFRTKRKKVVIVFEVVWYPWSVVNSACDVCLDRDRNSDRRIPYRFSYKKNNTKLKVDWNWQQNCLVCFLIGSIVYNPVIVYKRQISL